MTISKTAKEYQAAKKLHSKFGRTEYIIAAATTEFKRANERLCKELAYSKDLRNRETLERLMSERNFAKAQIVIGHSILRK